MVNQELVKYFREGMKLGNPANVLENSLIQAGWDGAEVEEASELVQLEQVQNKKIEDKNYSLGLGNLGKNKKPLGVIVVASLHWAIALSIVVSAILSLSGQNSFDSELFELLFGFLSVALFFVVLIIALIPLFVGIGIWKGINSWRIVAIVFGCISTFFGLLSLFNPTLFGVINLIISGYIAGYLIFSKEGKKYFHKKN
jgi:hypothetical protein